MFSELMLSTYLNHKGLAKDHNGSTAQSALLLAQINF